MAQVDFSREEFEEFASEHDVSEQDSERLWEEMNLFVAPRQISDMMQRADKMFHTHGVGSLGMPPHPQVLFLEMGDTYIGTLLFEQENSTFHITSWGDFLEEWQNENLQEVVTEAWDQYGEDEFVHKLIELEPELEEEVDRFFDGRRLDEDGPVEHMYQAISRTTGESPYIDGDQVSFRPILSDLKRVSADPDALHVAWALAEVAAGDDGPTGANKSAQECLEYLFKEVNDRWSSAKMPAFFYLLMLMSPKAARFLGVKPNAEKFVEAWLETSITDPELTWTTIDDPNYIDHASALAIALGTDEVKLRILGDAIEEGDMENALEVLAKKAPPKKERQHGLDGR